MKRIILAGGSGFIGQALAEHFLKAKWEVVVLTRFPRLRGDGVREIQWDGHSCDPWLRELEGASAIVNLAGRSVDCRFNARNRKEIMESRVNATRAIGTAISQCAIPPLVWINAGSATIYKDTLGDPWDEAGDMDSVEQTKDPFSLEVAKAWEAAMQETPTPRTRKVVLRMGLVLGTGKNSIFPVLQRLVKLGLGGKMGRGNQYVSWIHIADYCRAVEWIISHNELSGPVNMTTQNPVSNREMMSALRKACGMPFGLPASRWMLEIGALLLGKETELIIKSRRVIPGCLLKSGFAFEFPTIEQGFKDLVSHPKSSYGA